MSKFSLAILLVLAVSNSIILAENDGKYRSETTVASKKLLVPVIGHFKSTQYDGKYTPKSDGKHRGNEDGKYHNNDAGKYSNKNEENNKAAGLKKSKVLTRSTNSGGNIPLRRTVPRAIPQRRTNVLPSSVSRRGASAGRNDFQIIQYSKEEEIDGYRFIYETENGIIAEEEGHLEALPTGEGIRTKGSFEYTGDDGVLYRVDYVADDAGFVPQGAHIHPTPPHVVKLLQYLALNAKK